VKIIEEQFTNIGLVKHVKMALRENWGYVYGTIGQVLTDAILQYKKKQYPKNILHYEAFIRKTWIGRRTADCVNLIKSYIWWNNGNIKYSSDIDVSANGMYQSARIKGSINTMPDIAGICVRYDGHIGVYIGTGQVIEARGTKYGVVQTPLKGRGWTHWLECPYIKYQMTGDGKMDTWAEKAVAFVKSFQSAFGLVVDGKAGNNTNAMLEEIKKAVMEVDQMIADIKAAKTALVKY